MFKSRIIRIQDAELHFELMAYLIRTFGPPPRPPVPSPLHKSPGLETLAWTQLDKRSVGDWTEDHFVTIKALCHMDKFDISLIPSTDDLDLEICAVTERLNALAAGGMPYRQPGVSQVFYDPRDSSEPGHFVATTLLQLAELRVSNFRSGTALPGLMRRMMTLTAAAYNRQGFVLANLPDQVSSYLTPSQDLRAMPHRIVINNLCFATCLALRVRQQSEEQIIATYGVRMGKAFRKKVRLACRQIDSFAEELAILQLLAAPKPRQGPAIYNNQKSA